MARKSRKKNLQPGVVSVAEAATPEESKLLIPAAAYGRLSIENAGHENDESLQTQMDILYRYIGEHPELELAGSYMDNGFTGTNFERPEFQRLMDDAKTGRIKCIVVKDLSRFGRDYLETGYYMETILPHLNVRLISINDNFDSFRKEDRDSLAVPIKNIVNSMYAQDLSRKLCAAAEVRRKKANVVPYGNAPYGYEIAEDKTRYIVDSDAAVYIRTIFQWARMGIRIDEIAKRMNQMEIPVASDYRAVRDGQPSKNRKWTYATVRSVLTNRSYGGDTIMGKLKQSLYKSEKIHKVPEEEWTVIENTHEPLVSKPDLAEIDNLRSGENSYTYRDKKYNVIAREKLRDQMPGLVYCRECGCRMNYIRFRNDYSVATQEELDKELRGKKNGIGRTDYYDCPPLAGEAKCGGHHISADLLKIIVMDQLDFQIRYLVDAQKVFENAKAANNGKSPVLSTKRKLTSARKKLSDEENRIVKLYEDYAEGILTAEDYKKLRDLHLGKRAYHESECEKLEKSLLRQQTLLDNLSDAVRNFGDSDTDNGFNEELVRRAVEKIIVDADGNVTIRFTFQDTISELTKLVMEGEMLNGECDVPETFLS